MAKNLRNIVADQYVGRFCLSGLIIFRGLEMSQYLARGQSNQARQAADIRRAKAILNVAFEAMGFDTEQKDEPGISVMLGMPLALHTARELRNRFNLYSHVSSEPSRGGEWLWAPAWDVGTARATARAVLDILMRYPETLPPRRSAIRFVR